jgi:hypothetical protein
MFSNASGGTRPVGAKLGPNHRLLSAGEASDYFWNPKATAHEAKLT